MPVWLISLFRMLQCYADRSRGRKEAGPVETMPEVNVKTIV